MTDERSPGQQDLSTTKFDKLESDIERRVNTANKLSSLSSRLDSVESRLGSAFKASSEAREIAVRILWLGGAVVAFLGGMGVVLALVKHLK